jgi:tetratricopeptide (TPR) repeat protein
MGLLDRNKRKPAAAPAPFTPPPPPPPAPQDSSALAQSASSEPTPSSADGDSLRDMLIAAVATRDMKLFETLATANRAAITANFPQWQRVPEAIRNNGGAMQRYANMLIATAELFRERFNDTALIARLTAPPETADPIRAQWEQALAQADAVMQDLRFDEALETVPVGGPVPYHAVTHGRLSHALFATGKVDAAAEEMRIAFELSQQTGDNAGIAAGLRGMYDIHRYMGKFSEAADFAVQLSEQLAKMDATADSQYWAKQAARVRAGEPLCRVIFFVEDKQYELDEVPKITEGGLRYAFVRNRPPLGLCEGLMHRGIQVGKQAKFEEALELFRQAAVADPYDPNPHYQAAVTLMHLERAPQAVDAYDTVEKLAPGWFHSRGERWIASEIAAGRLEHAIFFVLRTEEMPDPAMTWEQKLALVDQAILRAGELAPLLLYRARCLMRLGKLEEAVPVLRAGLEKAENADLRTRILVDLQMLTPDPDEKRRLLTQAIELNGNLAAAAVARVTLKSLESEHGK